MTTQPIWYSQHVSALYGLEPEPVRVATVEVDWVECIEIMWRLRHRATGDTILLAEIQWPLGAIGRPLQDWQALIRLGEDDLLRRLTSLEDATPREWRLLAEGWEGTVDRMVELRRLSDR